MLNSEEIVGESKMTAGIKNKTTLIEYYKSNGFLATFNKIIYHVVHNILLYSLPYSRMGDRIYSFVVFVLIHHRLPNNQLFNDLLYNIKTSDEILNPIRTFVSDKEFLKLYVKAQVGENYNVPTIAILSNYSELEKFDLPEVCCVKPTHASGLVVFQKQGERIDKKALRHWFKLNYYRRGREANYKYLKPKIIVEPLIFNKTDNVDYKFFCFQGVVKFVQVDIDRHTSHTRKFFDVQWKELDFSILYPKSTKHIAKPENFSDMLNVVSMLSRPFSLVRIDLYSDGQNIYVGEITNIPENITGLFIPKSAEAIVLSESTA